MGTWTFLNKETWTLLPDESILSVNCQGNPGAQNYVIVADEGSSAVN
jgi:hypothetical protein